jgi:hypothetical protein
MNLDIDIGISKMREIKNRAKLSGASKGHDHSQNGWKLLLPSVLMGLLSLPALAAQQQYSFTVTGNNGETGSGTFIWDDSVIPDGGSLDAATGDFLSFSVTIVGGNATGGSTTFDLADCTSVAAANTPTFSVNLRANCNNGIDSIATSPAPIGFAFENQALNVSTITVVSGTTMPVPPSPAQPVPVASIWMLIAASLGLGFLARRRLRNDMRSS